jgi:DNA helicase HerA-like ATPase
MSFKLPNLTQRLTVIGSTGSGKTRFGVWALSESGFDKQPFVILDYKRDDLIEQVDRAREIGLNEVPKAPGLYVLRPTPVVHDEHVENWLWKVWAKGHVGLYADEAYMLPKGSPAFNAILTQGRSKRIPVTTLTQRPSWVSRFVFSEANHYAIFNLSDGDDVKTTQRFVPKQHGSLEEPLPRFHSRYFDRDANELHILKPVPSDDDILGRLHERLKPRKRVY